MATYITCFALSTSFLWIDEKLKLKTISHRILVCIALILPCLVAALRSDSIGTDVLVYAKPIYTAALNSKGIHDFFTMSWFSIWRYKTITEFEPGFTLLVYFTTKTTHSFSFVLGVIELFMVIPIYSAISKFRPKLKVWIGMLAYYLLFFNVSLNLMRQMIACAFCLLAYTYLIQEDRKRYLLFNIIAVCFHKMAVLGFVTFGIYILVIRKNNTKKLGSKKAGLKFRIGSLKIENYFLRTLGITVLCLMCFLILPLIKQIMCVVGFAKFTMYLSGTIHFMPNQIVLRIPLIFMIIYSRKYVKEGNPVYYFFLAMQLVELVFSQLAGAYEQAIRMNYFFSIINILIIPYMCQINKKGTAIIKQWYFSVYLIAYWLYYYIYSGTMETYPYIFR